MNERTFLDHVADDHDTVVEIEAHIYAALCGYCKREEIPSNEVSDEQLRELANGIVERGLSQEVYE
jgi:hypothetical protein